jgi:hypothetical protein
MTVYDNSVKQADKANALLSEADKTMAALRNSVPFDARAGFPVDLYWFGVPKENHVYHQGNRDLKATSSFTNKLDEAVNGARAAARGAVSDLLVDESPAYASLKSEHDLVGAKLDVSKKIVSLADQAGRALDDAERYIRLRNMTSETVTVDDYTTLENSDGTTSQVRSGSHEETNPDWEMYDRFAYRAKRDSEGLIRELNGTVVAASTLLPPSELRQIDANLVGAFGFFREPSFGAWSFDSFSVDDAQRQVQHMEVAGAKLVGQFQGPFDRLDGQVNQQIDTRWQALRGSPQS